MNLCQRKQDRISRSLICSRNIQGRTVKYFIYTCIIRSTGPIAVARRRSVGRSVCLSVNTCNSATNVRIFFKIGGNIPWVNITRRFFRFCKIFNFEFKKK